jgi:putative hydrolase of the HAD superfamily
MRNLKTICLDADDTLWQNERFFKLTQERFVQLLADFAQPDHLEERLLEAEIRNLKIYGFGVKGFVLSMIETALNVTDHTVSGQAIAEIMAAGREMLDHPIDLFKGVAETVKSLSQTHQLILITKGDLLDQERKLAQSGLGAYFDAVEIVSDKTPSAYSEIFKRHNIAPESALMAGNSLKSDVLPVLDTGAWAVYVPSDLTWALEVAQAPINHPKFRQITRLSALPGLIATIC